MPCLKCPICGEYRTTARGLYWHLKIDCDASTHDEAFELVAQAMNNIELSQQLEDLNETVKSKEPPGRSHYRDLY